MSASLAQPAQAAVSPTEHFEVPRVGPNAIIQTAAALREGLGEEAAQKVFAEARLEHILAEQPAEMVPEDAVAALFHAQFKTLNEADAQAIAADAGKRTADYILRHRIPGPARGLLSFLPPSLGARFLLKAIARHAWTFAGSGEVRVVPGDPALIEIRPNRLATPGCPWHCAVFQRLFRALVTSEAEVSHPICGYRAGGHCQFEVRLSRSQHGA